MKILLLCNKPPYPPKDGGSLGIHFMIDGLLNSGHELKVLSFNTSKLYVEPGDLPPVYRERTRIEFVDLNLDINPIKAFLNLFTGRSFHIERFISEQFSKKLISVLQHEKFDIVQLEYLYMTPYIPVVRKYSTARIILRSHNVESQIWERIASAEKNPLKKLYLLHLTRTLKRYEISVINQVDGIITVSRLDTKFYLDNGCTIPLTDIPFGLDPAEYDPDQSKVEFPSFFHLGAMNWTPNLEGIQWFIDQVWPAFHRKHPTLTFTLAGRFMPDWMMNTNIPGIEVAGEVDDLASFMQSKAVMVVPLLSGSGIRVKIVEALALGKTVISTSIGAEGINYTTGHDMLIANNPDEMIRAMEKCMSDRENCLEIGRNARELACREHDRNIIMQKLAIFYNNIPEK